jgi:lysophospholipase L1-like esterase
MSSLLRLRTITCTLVLLSPACVAKLTDRNSPAPNGAVTGPAANCAVETPLPHGAPGGEAAPKLVGRFAFSEETPGEALFDWSGNYVTVRFQGTSQVTARLRLPGEVPEDQLFTFVVDNQPPEKRLITVKTDAAGKPTLEPEERYDVTGLDPAVPHELTIYKDTEAQKGGVVFKGFDLHGGTMLPPTRRPRRIEFIGDSITCGYGNEGKNATCPFETKVREVTVPGRNGAPPHTEAITVPLTENQYLSFAAIAARELDADAVTICFSGKGVYLNYKERFKTDPNDPTKWLYRSDDHSLANRVPEEDAKTTMSQYWATRTVATDFQGNAWDFSKERPEEIPQVVFISLGTNDLSRDTKEPASDPTKQEGDNQPDGDLARPEERERFFQAYLALVKQVREKRPDAQILLATPPMVSDQFPFENARTLLRGTLARIVDDRARAGDAKVYRMELVEQGFRYGLGCDYHPNLEVHRIMATQLVGAIRSKTCW